MPPWPLSDHVLSGIQQVPSNKTSWGHMRFLSNMVSCASLYLLIVIRSAHDGLVLKCLFTEADIPMHCGVFAQKTVVSILHLLGRTHLCLSDNQCRRTLLKWVWWFVITITRNWGVMFVYLSESLSKPMHWWSALKASLDSWPFDTFSMGGQDSDQLYFPMSLHLLVSVGKDS